MPSEVHPESCLVAFFSTHELVFASASLMVPERTAEALAMVRSFMASAPMSAIGAVPCSTEVRMAMMASAERPESARSATRKPSTWGLAVRYWLTRSNVMGLSSKSKQSWPAMAASSPVLSPSTATSCCAAMGSMRRLRRSKHCMVKLSFASAFLRSATASLTAPALVSWSMSRLPLMPPSCWQMTMLASVGLLTACLQ